VRHRRRDVAARDRAELGGPPDADAGRQEERAVVGMIGPVTVVAAASRRPDVLFAARLAGRSAS